MGDQNSLRQCIRRKDDLQMIDFGVAGFRRALIAGMPHRTTWCCIQRIPKRLSPTVGTGLADSICGQALRVKCSSGHLAGQSGNPSEPVAMAGAGSQTGQNTTAQRDSPTW